MRFKLFIKTTFIFLFIYLFIFFVNFTISFAQSSNITPKKGVHPRLLVKSEDIETIKQKFASPYFQKNKNEILKNSTLQTNTVNNYIKSIESNALLYLIYQDPAQGSNAIKLLENALKSDTIFSTSMDYSRLTFSAALVYDWCYPLLFSEQKTFFIAKIKYLTSRTELKYPLQYQSCITGHGNHLLLKNLLAASVSIYDEDASIYNAVYKDIVNKFIPARKFTYRSGTHYQGTNYGSARFEGEIISTAILDKIGFPNAYGKSQYLIPYSWIYAQRGDKRFLPDGDTFDTKYTSPLSYIISAYLSNDPYLIDFSANYYYYYIDEPILFLIFYKPTNEVQTKRPLPNTKYFSSPIGKMIARTGWDMGKDSNSVVAEFKVGEYNFANHAHLDAGSFQIYYKGSLAIDSGVYEGNTGGYNSDHFKNYYKRTIAHNSLLVNDPTEIFRYENTEVVNDGGQRFPNKGHEAANLNQILTKGFKTGNTLKSWYGPDKNEPTFSYLKGDIKAAYSNKIQDYTRTFVFINHQNQSVPASLIVLDKVKSKDPTFKKTWLLHSIEEPEYINNSQIVIKRTADGYNGKLTNDILIPANNDRKVNIIGGSKKEFLVNNVNYSNTPNVKDIDAGNYRVEISPLKKQHTDTFLNVMKISDADKSHDYKARKTDINSAVIAVDLSNYRIIFSKTNNEIAQDFSFNNKHANHFLLTDLKTGFWSVYADDKTLITKKAISSKSPIITFNTTAKKVLVVYNEKQNFFVNVFSRLINLFNF